MTESVSMGRSRPKEKHQHDSPNDTPYSPSDVGVFRLPFQDSFVKGHDKCPSLLSSHDTESHEALITSTVKDSHRCSTTSARFSLTSARAQSTACHSFPGMGTCELCDQSSGVGLRQKREKPHREREKPHRERGLGAGLLRGPSGGNL